VLSYVFKDLLRNPRRTMASVAGVALAVGLFSGIAFFVDSSASQMTARAVAPVVIDMQAGVTRPLASALSVKESTSPAPPFTAGQLITATITVTNAAQDRTTAVIVKDALPSQLAYVPGSTTAGNAPRPDMPDQDGTSTTPLATGLNVGDLAPGTSAIARFQVRAVAAVPATTGLPLGATARSAEYPAPITAGDTPAPALATIRSSIQSVSGVVSTQPFALADLPAGRLRAGSAVVNQQVKVVAFDPAYLQAFPAVRVTGGQFLPGAALLSQPAADTLSAVPGTALQVLVPGAAKPLQLPLAGIADFSSAAATQLFASRNPDTQGEVVAVPNVLVMDFATFSTQVLPALRADAAAPTPLVTTAPVIEYHVALSRSLLSGDPATAVIRTAALRRTIERIAPGEIKAIDNLTDTLTAAQRDSTLAKVLFLFLGLPGVLLAAYLSRYAGGLLAQAQRRERATLRARGMQPSQLMRALAYNTFAVAAVGAVVGLALGLTALVLVFGGSSAGGASAQAYGLSIVASLVAAAVTTTVALYLPARRALSQEVAEERRDVEANVQPAWLRLRLDLVMLVAAAIIGGITYLTGGFKPTSIEGQSVSLSFYILLAPLFFWVGGTLLLVRILLAGIGRGNPARPNGDFGKRLVLRTLMLSVRRRPQAIASGVIALSLAIAFGASLAIFVTTYQAEKLADARFVVGGDLRVTPTATAKSTPASAPRVDAHSLGAIAGVRAVAAMDQASVVVGTDKKALAAIDPRTFGHVASLSPAFFDGVSSDAALKMLAADPRAALMDTELAKTFNIQAGDQVKLQLTDRVTGKMVPTTLHAVAIFKNFPGFPQGVDLVSNLGFYQQTVRATSPDTFLLRTDGTDAGTAEVAAVIKQSSTPAQPLTVDSTARAYNIDQSSLSSLNIAGLGRLDGLYTVLMSALGIAIFVFGLLLQRAKEHVTMRALGIRMVQLQGLVLGEAGLVAVVSLVIGGLVGTAMSLMFVQILRPLFIIAPDGLAVPAVELVLLAVLVLAAMALSSVVAGASLRRMHLVEILREE
jgi:putative ABC transport system permease protein